MDNPKVVICMSTYNGEKFLAQQLDSFIAQTHQNWRLIVHDDGSTDSTKQILARYADLDDRVRVVDDEGHLGIKRAFLSLLSKEDAELYAFSDQDDVWHEDKLAVLVARLRGEDPSVPTLIYSRFDEIDAQNQILPDRSSQAVYSTRLKDFLLINTATGCTCMVNHALRDQLIRPLTSLRLSAIHMHDWWAALVASALGQVIFVNQKLVSYRQHGNNVLGAPTGGRFLKRFGRFLEFRESRIVDSGTKQAGELLRLYGPQLSVDQTQLVAGVADLFHGWAPIKKQRFLKRQGLFIRSKFLNIETILLLWMFPSQRRRVFSRNEV
ncbi:glycosyltransferase family 2 protein [Lacticaseibacillus jixianensis]|uniref:Glycosyltransferase family 2 protein n=1 Tax=Lacticaseibacillus jixianensis TaxID=2486012 RepID=A0ABW4BAM6_9LACO|nr:glycosyltransferase family 2 protein [Lacticaseibacillus jixianensis]